MPPPLLRPLALLRHSHDGYVFPEGRTVGGLDLGHQPLQSFIVKVSGAIAAKEAESRRTPQRGPAWGWVPQSAAVREAVPKVLKPARPQIALHMAPAPTRRPPGHPHAMLPRHFSGVGAKGAHCLQESV